MADEQAQTLRQYLDSIGIESGSDALFVVQELNRNTEFQCSRRYLECPTWVYMLDLEIYDYVYPFYDIYGVETIKLILDDRGLIR